MDVSLGITASIVAGCAAGILTVLIQIYNEMRKYHRWKAEVWEEARKKAYKEK